MLRRNLKSVFPQISLSQRLQSSLSSKSAQLHIAHEKHRKEPNHENFRVYLEQLNKMGKYDMVLKLKEEFAKEGPRGLKAKRIHQEFNFAEKMESQRKNFSYYQGKIPPFSYRLPLFALAVMWSFELGQEDQPKEGIGKKIEKLMKKLRNFKYYQGGFDLTTVYEVIKPENIKEELKDIKGIDECIVEIQEVIRFLKDPDLFLSKGAKIPKGVLLYGEPGVGKTMIARGIAKEANVKFIYQNGSTFDEMFVGQGSQRVRALFKKAKQIKPCIIFIDQIDSLLSKTKRSHQGSSSSATVNNFLSEIDGFQKNENIIVLGATNSLQSIDQAAARPGRFDSKIYVPKPDEKGRAQLFKHYLQKISHNSEINPELLAKSTANLSPAQISNLVNTAICDAVHDSRFIATLQDVYEARDKILMGLQRKSLTMSQKQRLKIAIHEMGHTMANLYTEGSLDLEKVTIIPRGRALGVTLQQMSEERMRTLDKESVIALIDVAMGGHVAEKIFIGESKVASGCSNDLEKATQIARDAVRKHGMFKNYGVGLIASQFDEVSERYNNQIDDCVRRILQESLERVYNLLLSRHQEFTLLSKELYLHDTLTAQQIDTLRSGHKLRQKPVRTWSQDLEEFYKETKRQIRKKGGKKGSPPIVEIVRTPLLYREEEKDEKVISQPHIEPTKEEDTPVTGPSTDEPVPSDKDEPVLEGGLNIQDKPKMQ